MTRIITTTNVNIADKRNNKNVDRRDGSLFNMHKIRSLHLTD
jgi:hypothetical protein